MTTAALHTHATRRRSAFWLLAGTEGRLFLRSAGSVLWTALLPVVAVVVLGVVPATRHASRSFGGLSPLEVYVPILMMYVFLMAAVNMLPAALTGYRSGACCAGCPPPRCRPAASSARRG
ncbi:hypothetical protein GXW82_14565 [Streptacidiphilus sp. 4-A2]|nr:hypothetical protein [Streptacidiphilus sp. 4-A2]